MDNCKIFVGETALWMSKSGFPHTPIRESNKGSDHRAFIFARSSSNIAFRQFPTILK